MTQWFGPATCCLLAALGVAYNEAWPIGVAVIWLCVGLVIVRDS